MAQLSWTGDFSVGRDRQPDIYLSFLDAQHGFVMDPLDNEDHGLLFRTRDGGATWQPLPLPGSPAVGSALSFVNPDDGWLLADVGEAMSQSSATIYRTVDGGAHWSSVAHVDYGGFSHGLSSGGDKDSLVFRSTSVGWITAYSAAEDAPPIIWLTRDGGKNWLVQLPLVPAP